MISTLSESIEDCSFAIPLLDFGFALLLQRPGTGAIGTCFVKESGLLTKKICLAADGATVIDSSECRMPRGTMERVLFSDWRQLATGLGNLPSNTAIALERVPKRRNREGIPKRRES